MTQRVVINFNDGRPNTSLMNGEFKSEKASLQSAAFLTLYIITLQELLLHTLLDCKGSYDNQLKCIFWNFRFLHLQSEECFRRLWIYYVKQHFLLPQMVFMFLDYTNGDQSQLPYEGMRILKLYLDGKLILFLQLFFQFY